MNKKELIKQNDANDLIEQISKQISFKESDEKNQLYGSISKKEILGFFSENGLKIKSDDLIIKDQIKSLGEHEIEINPYIGISKILQLQ